MKPEAEEEGSGGTQTPVCAATAADGPPRPDSRPWRQAHRPQGCADSPTGGRDGAPLKSAWWRWVLVLLLTFVAAVTTGVLLMGILRTIFGSTSLGHLWLTFLSLAVYLPCLLFFARLFHGVPARAFLTSHPRFRWKRLFQAAGFWLAAMLLTELVTFLFRPAAYHWHFDPATFPSVLVCALLVVPFQAAAEEALFRGYLLQGLTRLFRNPWVAMAATSLAFFALHATNPEFQKFGLGFAIANYLVMGLFFGAIVLIDGGLEAAIGIHAINNVYGTALVGFNDSAAGAFSLIIIDPYDPFAGTIGFLACVALVAVALWRTRRQAPRLSPMIEG